MYKKYTFRFPSLMPCGTWLYVPHRWHLVEVYIFVSEVFCCGIRGKNTIGGKETLFSCLVASDSLQPHGLQHARSLSFTISWSLLKLMFIEPVMLSDHLILSSPSPAFSLSQHHGLSQWFSSSNQVAKVLELYFQHQSFQWIFRVDFL